MNRIILSITTLLSLTAVYAIAGPTNWQVSGKYNVNFTGGGEVGGIFKTLKCTISFDEQNPGASSIDLTIDVASVNTGNGLMNTHLKSTEWLDAAKFPAIHFTSKKIVKTGTTYQVTGELELHGVKKEVTMPFSFQSSGAGGTFSSKFSVSRGDFHIGKPGGEVDEQIKLDIKVPVVKKQQYNIK